MVNIDEKELIKQICEKNELDNTIITLTTMINLMSIDLSRIIQAMRKDKNCVYCIGECKSETPCTECLLSYYKNLAEMIVDTSGEN